MGIVCFVFFFSILCLVNDMVVMFFSKDLKNSKQELEKQHKALEVEYKELKRLSISVESVSIFHFVGDFSL